MQEGAAAEGDERSTDEAVLGSASQLLATTGLSIFVKSLARKVARDQLAAAQIDANQSVQSLSKLPSPTDVSK
jgi:hypothetical protein